MTGGESDQRLKKLKALAERGIGGEKENAQALLEKLCEKYGISLDQIESSDERKTRWFTFLRKPFHRKLLFQCIFKTIPDGDRKVYRRGIPPGQTSELGVDCTDAEAIEIELDYSFFSKCFESEIERFYDMFVQKNDIFPPNCEMTSTKCPTEADFHLFRGINRKTRAPQIPEHPAGQIRGGGGVPE